MAQRAPHAHLRNCYCRLGMQTCGTCGDCGRPGHARHHPGGPMTASWCDGCFAGLVRKIEEDAATPCALCGEPGHSRATHRCASCGALGHRGRACPAGR